MNKRKGAGKSLTVIGIAYGMMALGDMTTWNIINNWLTYFYLSENSALTPASLFSAVMFLNGIVGVLIALPIGYWSDRLRSPWGRRLPFMFMMALPRLILFILLWTPPFKGESAQNALYLGAVLLCHEIAAGLYQIPSNALLPEIARTDAERVRISAWAGGLGLLGMVVSSFAGLAIERFGYPKAAFFFTLGALPFFYLPFLVLRERPVTQAAAPVKLDFRRSLSLTIHNRPFLIMIGINALCISSIFLMQSIFPFIAAELLGLPEGYTTYLYVSGLIASLACYPLITWLSDRLGKRRVFSGSLLAAALILPCLLLIGDWLPIPLLAAGIIWVVLEAVALSGATTLQPTFIADIVDDDAEKMGQRREGAFYAASEFVERIVYGIAGALLPLLLLLGRGQSAPHGPLGIRIVGVVGSLLTLAAFFLFRAYPLQARHEHVEVGG